ncbi:MAG: CAP domain-containing protein [Rubellimicrobium sp.]|nr:CAP domain-containing protein [Rubellimicrobium sp.]
MLRRNVVMMGAAVAGLAACARPAARIGADGLPEATIFRITDADAQVIPYRMQESINTLRRAAGAGSLQLDAQLTASAATHSRDMAVQNRPWHFGSDGSSPVDRLRRVGYPGQLVGETISESFEDDISTLAAWMDARATREVIMDPSATRMGIAWFQEQGGKIWWTLVLGR